MRNHERFTGARYEIQVAAAFIRAGFDIAFEDETDGSTTHCEFTATYRRTGKRFSVEAKRREGHRPRIGRLFNDALSKRANYPRIVFIDLNMRDDGPRTEQAPPEFFQSALRRLRSFEGQPLNGEARPPAYVFLTNTPWPLYLDDTSPRCGLLAEGFQIPDFKEGVWFPSLRQIINAREAHIEMHNLMESIRDHSEIPSTFDGELPEFAFDQQTARLLIGARYLVKDADGVERPAELTTATVAEDERKAYCGVSFDNGKSGIWTVPLADAEMAAWKRHPDTFFGELGQRRTRVETPLELYDFLHQSFTRCRKEQLLKAMADSADIEQLAQLEQEELASIHAERLTYGALAMKNK